MRREEICEKVSLVGVFGGGEGEGLTTQQVGRFEYKIE